MGLATPGMRVAASLHVVGPPRSAEQGAAEPDRGGSLIECNSPILARSHRQALEPVFGRKRGETSEMRPGRRGIGGKRAGAGRPRGAKNKRTLALEAARANGERPLDFMLRVMRNEAESINIRADMAKAAAPYCQRPLHPLSGHARSL